jgi:hypothetical protein
MSLHRRADVRAYFAGRQRPPLDPDRVREMAALLRRTRESCPECGAPPRVPCPHTVETLRGLPLR